MSKPIAKGWVSPCYHIRTAKEWSNRLWATYPRASDLLMEICGKTVKDTAFLAQKTYRGWELWKMAVKAVETGYEMLNLGLLKNKQQLIIHLNGTTIHALSILLRCHIDSIKNDAKLEADYLTDWFRSVLSS